MYDEAVHGVNQRRYIWLIQPFVKAKINFTDSAKSNEVNLFKYISPFLEVLNNGNNLHNGLSDYAGNHKQVYASLLSHACLVEALNDIQQTVQ